MQCALHQFRPGCGRGQQTARVTIGGQRRIDGVRRDRLAEAGAPPQGKTRRAVCRSRAACLATLVGIGFSLGLAAPMLGSAGVVLSDRVKNQVEAAARSLEFIEKVTATAALVPGHGTPSPSGRTIRAETGADFRALYDMLLALDPDNEKNWGRLSPVSRPEDLRTIYLCPGHINDFDYPYTATRLTP